MADLTSFGNGLNVLIIGASGGIGSAFMRQLALNSRVSSLLAASRSRPDTLPSGARHVPLDLEDEASVAAAVDRATDAGPLNLVIVASGVLHQADGFQPEKTWAALTAADMARAFAVNTIGPALVLKHAGPHLARDRKAVFAALSARVGSISDNRIGGWYSYRASKAALNQIIKTGSIELARRSKQALCVGLHPGTVDTDLSKPFQRGVAPEKLFTADHAAESLLQVIDSLGPEASGQCFAWDGKAVDP